ncbi:MAG: hypothetical protein LBR32_04250, partial [Propionibacteriaceae bacterium]|nr:hypothetical protein [Propionibacteriaceae bacterium]
MSAGFGSRRRVLAAGAVLALLVSVLPAVALASAPYRVGYAVGSHTLGTLAPRTGSGGSRVVCVDSDKDDDSSLQDDGSGGSDELSYLLAEYVDQTGSDLEGAALAYIVKSRLGDPGWSSLWSAFKASHDESKVLGKVADLEDEAGKRAGPYKLAVADPRASELDKATGTVPVRGSLRAKGGKGSHMSGVGVTLTISGPAVWANGKKSVHFTTDGHDFAVPMTVEDVSKIKISGVTDADLPPVSYKKYKPKTAGKQDMVSRSSGGSSAKTESAAVFQYSTQPQLASQVSSQLVEAGSVLADSVVVSGGTPGASYKVETDVWGPLADNPAAALAGPPAGVPLFQSLEKTVRLDGAGGAVVEFATTRRVEEAGGFVWRERAAAQGLMLAATTAWGRPTEVSLRAWAPRLGSEAMASKIAVGEPLSDKVTVRGGKPGAQLTVLATAYGPFADWPAASDAAPADAPVFEQEATTVTLDGNGAADVVFTTARATVSTGYYVWQESSVAMNDMAAASSMFGRPEESQFAWAPRLSSEVSEALEWVGSPLVDTVMVEDGVANADYTVSTRLWGPFADKPGESATAPEGAVLFQELEQTVRLDASGSGQAVFTSAAIAQPGWYVWQERAAAQGGAPAVETSFGRASEMSRVSRVSLSSQVADAYTPAGGTLSDTVSVADGRPGADLTVVAAVWGPLDSQPAGELEQPPAGAAKAAEFEQTIRLDNNGRGSATFTTGPLSGTGYYVWRESSKAGGGMAAATSTFGRASETASIPTARLSSQVSAQEVVVGEELSDTVVVSGFQQVAGAAAAKLVLTGQVFGPVAPRAVYPDDPAAPAVYDCSAVSWDGAPLAADIGPLEVSGNATLEGVGRFAPAKVGCYTWAWRLSAASQSGQKLFEVDHPKGQASQTALAAPKRSVVSQVERKVVAGGAVLVDAVSAGWYPNTAVRLVDRLYGPFEPGKLPEGAAVPEGARLVAEQASDGVTDADGNFSATFSFTIPADGAAGDYVWVETLYDTRGAVPTPVETAAAPTDTPAASAAQVAASAAAETAPQAAPRAPDPAAGEAATDPAADQAAGEPQQASDSAPAQAADGLARAARIGQDAAGEAAAPTPEGGADEAAQASGQAAGEQPAESAVSAAEGAATPAIAATGAESAAAAGGVEGTGSSTPAADSAESAAVPASAGAAGGASPAAQPYAEVATGAFGRASETLRVVPRGAVVSKASASEAGVGATVSDAVALSGAAAVLEADQRAAVTLSGKLLGPAKAVGGGCDGADWDGAPVAAEIAEISVVGDVELDGLGAHLLRAPGCYTYTYTFKAVSQDEAVWETVHEPGQPSQTVLVAPPAMRTQTSAQTAGVGAAISDAIEVSGFDKAGAPDGTTVTATPLGPLAAPDGGTCADLSAEDWQKAVDGDEGGLRAGPPQSLPVAGNGELATAPFRVAAPGCYTWVEAMANADGDELSRTSPGEASETTLVAPPTMRTQTSAQTAGVGASLTDTIEVSGFDPAGASPGTVIVAALRGPLPAPAPGGCQAITAAAWAEAIAADPAGLVVGSEQRLDAKGNGTVRTGPVLVQAAGCYTWTERMEAPERPDQPIAETPPGEEFETTLVAPPTMRTQTSAQTAGVGASLTDAIEVSGFDPAGAPPGAQIEAALRGPLPIPESGDCSSIAAKSWVDAISASTTGLVVGAVQTLQVAGNGQLATGPAK